MSDEDNVTVGLTEETHVLLQRLRDDGVFKEMRDAYRFGIALAIARSRIAPPGLRYRTVLNIGSLDKDGSIRNIVTELYPEAANTPYSVAERLAEAGVSEIGRLHESGQLRFGELAKVVSQGESSI